MAVDFVKMDAGRIAEALGMMRRFYAEEGLEFRQESACGALEYLAAHAEAGGVWLMEERGRTVGYFALTVCHSLEFGGRFALLDEFFVEAPHRGAGAGTRALERIEEEAARMGVEAVRLEVDRGNARARAFYERSGFAAHERDLMTKWLRSR